MGDASSDGWDRDERSESGPLRGRKRSVGESPVLGWGLRVRSGAVSGVVTRTAGNGRVCSIIPVWSKIVIVFGP